MDVIKAIQHYLEKIINETSGMKTLLLDTETTPIVSLAMTQSYLLTKECYLIDRVDNRNRDRQKFMKCVCFLRPSSDSIQYLTEELRDPAYGEYYLYFSNTLRKSDIERLAEVDEHEVVKEVQEYYGDYLAINSDLFSLGMDPKRLFGDSSTTWNMDALDRSLAGLSAVLLSLKKKPQIRYERTSKMAKRLAEQVQEHINKESKLFDFRRTDIPPLLLIVDRRNDPVTPLLSQWTYQAMVHDLIGIHHGRVDMSNVPEINSELKEIVLSSDQDPFFKNSMYLNLGDLGAHIKKYVDEYQARTNSNKKIESISDMKRFVEEYPEFRKLSSNVSKHVALVSELSRRVSKERRLEVSELEQNLACNENHNSDLKNITRIIGETDISDDAKVGLVLLYALRYEERPGKEIQALINQLDDAGVSEKKSALVPALLCYSGHQERNNDLFSNQTFLSRGKQALKGLKGIENVYTQHTPLLGETLDQIIRPTESVMRRTMHSYPCVDGSVPRMERPQDIIVFMVGGTTFEEARHVAQLNEITPGVRIVLGGTCVHNRKSFLEQVNEVERYMNVSRRSARS